MAMEATVPNHGLSSMGSFGLQVLTGRWFMVFASLLIMSVAGSTYIFGLYSGEVKTSLGYDQTTLNLLGFFKDLGANVGIISGLINEVTPPWVVLLAGAIMNFSGYFMIWLAVAGHIGKPKLWQMCLYISIGANSQTFSNTGALVTCVKNFPESRGIVLGLLKGFVGLSGAIITQLYHAFYGNDGKSLILLIGWLPAVVSVVFLRTVRIMRPAGQANDIKIFYRLLFVSLGLAGFLMIIIVVQNRVAFTRPLYAGSATVVLILLFAPLFIVFREEVNLWGIKQREIIELSKQPLQVKIENPAAKTEHLSAKTEHLSAKTEHLRAKTEHSKAETEHSKGKTEHSLPETEQLKAKTEHLSPKTGHLSLETEHSTAKTEYSTVKTEHLSPDTEHSTTKTEHFSPEAGEDSKQGTWWYSNIFKPPPRGEDYTILQALFSIDMIALFTATTFGVGGTLTAIDNLGQIGRSLGYPADSITTFVSLVSIWNYLGRVASGFLSEIFLARYKFPRPLMLTVVLLLSCVGHLLIAFGVPNSLYIASVLMGFCFGAQWPLIFAIISEIFGLKYYSTLYNFGGGASPVGAYLLNVRVAGHLYDRAATRQLNARGLTRNAGEDLTCDGVECYKLAFLIITACTFLSVVVSSVLVIRTREFYKGDIYKKFREQAGGGAAAEEQIPATKPPVHVDDRCN